MKVTVMSSKAVEPAYDSGGAPCLAAAAAVVPLTVFDKPRPTEPSSWGSPRPWRRTARGQGASAWTPAGSGDRAILLNDAGARLVEATADIALGDLMPLEPTPELLALYPAAGAGAEELMLVQVTRFACGSFAVGTTVQHLVADGTGARAFIVAWANATRGAAIDPVVPARDRASIFAPCCPPRERGAKRNAGPSYGDELVVHRLRFDREFLAKLRSAASAGAAAPRLSYSAVLCVAAHLWRCITKARGLGAAEITTTLRIAVDGRRRMRHPRLPEGYTGNVVLWARPAAAAGELVSMPLGHAAALVSRAVSHVDDRYFRSFIGFASSAAVEAEGLAPAADPARTARCPDVEVYSLVGAPLHDLDFGTGRPFLRTFGYMAEEGLVFTLSLRRRRHRRPGVPLPPRHGRLQGLLLHPANGRRAALGVPWSVRKRRVYLRL
ncbi:agmatine coumaroyltransferase-2-like [Panicum miliaceum]|uniref:Agmatine coumaroyltransferase-2-like n=1 Tax=Panicum miliaceum TaxID=4540 RepID=A0A3L6Q361_PANMI|nr:agmatine coumaroyltransferase-2-like [Panicum miliaceum]